MNKLVMSKLFGLIIILVLLFANISWTPPVKAAVNQPAGSKISSLLAMQIKTKLAQAANTAQSAVKPFGDDSPSAAEIAPLNQEEVFLHFAQKPSTSQLKDLSALGVTVFPNTWIPSVGAFTTGFVLADMPVTKLDALAAESYIVTMDTAEQTLSPQNDQAEAAMNVTPVWQGGDNGTGVTVAVLDSGIDTSNPDFPALNSTNSKDYSNYPTLDDTITNTVTGHGTHVTGSLLGRGVNSATYKGVAPGASLVFLKVGDDSTGSASMVAIAYAIEAAVDIYHAQIINLSYGSWSEYHDGSDPLCQVVDYATNEGTTVFVAAGNEGSEGWHFSGTVNGGSIIDIPIVASSSTSLPISLVWRDNGSQNNLTLQYYNASNVLLASINGGQTESERGTSMNIYQLNVPVGAGTYHIKVQNNTLSYDDFFHLYYMGGLTAVTFSNPDPNYTIDSPAEADTAIAVGCYVSRSTWTNYQGITYSYNTIETVGSIADSSSRGPRIDGIYKPDIVAPGSAIISVRDPLYASGNAGYDPGIIDNDGVGLGPNNTGPANYYVMQGTSMASPMAAGVGALLLSQEPGLTPAQIKSILMTTANKSAISFPQNNTCGAGLVDANAAISHITVLSNGTVNPEAGDTSTSFVFSVTYGNAHNIAPVSITISIDGGAPQSMTIKPGQNGNYSNGQIYQYTKNGFTNGNHYFSFAANDGTHSAVGDTKYHFGPQIGTAPTVVWVNNAWTKTIPRSNVDGHTFGSDAFASIQDGINFVASPGTVNVAAGTYFEEIDIKNGIILQGEGANTTILDGQRSSNVVTIRDASTIEGFTIQNGGAECGGGIYTYGAPIIKNNIIQNNAEWGLGGAAIYSNASSPIITSNIIRGNTGGMQWGEGALCFGNASSPVISNNLIENNSGYGAIDLLLPPNTPMVTNNTIVNNRGSGIVTGGYNTGDVIKNNIIVNNSQYGFYCDHYDAPQLSYNDIWNNTSGNYGGGVLTDQTGTNGNISADPLFVNSAANDYRLQSHSPCIDAGTNTGAPSVDFAGNIRPIDGDGNGTATADIGAYEYQLPVTSININAPPVIGSSVDANFTTQPVILVNDSLGHPINGVIVTASRVTGTGTLRGTLTATTNTSGLATFSNLGYNKSGETFTLRFSVGSLTVDSAVLGPLSVGAVIRVIVETAAGGSGTIVPGQNIAAGTALTVYAVSVDQYGNFVANAAGTWSLTGKTGNAADTDLVPAGDSKSAVFTGHLLGTAAIHVASGALIPIDSGIITVVPRLNVSGFTSPVTAGTTGSVTVTAQDTAGTTVTGYTGTVHFTSTDAQAILPSDYAFVSGDHGAHTFSITLKTAGTQSINAADTMNTTAVGTQSSIVVTAAGVSQIRVETAANGSGTVVAAQSVASGNSITVYAITRDTYGNFVSNAAGTWSLTGKTAGVVDGDLEIAFSFSCKHKKS
jgi:subtilisin family serine protease